MIEQKSGNFQTICLDQQIECKSPPRDLYQEYGKLVEDLRASPENIVQYQELIEEVLAPFAEEKGEFVIADNGKRISFSCGGKDFTNFGVVLLEVIEVHLIDSVEYKLELLVLGQNIPPRIIRLKSSELCSKHWIEDLGPKYIYEKRAIERIQVLIKGMSKYAPFRDEYEYSGWEVEDGKKYILDGCPLSYELSAIGARNLCAHALSMLDVAQHSLTIPLLAVELLALVHSKMVAGGTFFKGVCCIVAPTQSFKTTLAALFLNLNNGLEADLNFEATSAAIVRTIGTARDTAIILDDFKPGATRAERNDMTLKLSTVIRMCSDDSGGIKKAGALNSTISNRAHCMVLVTAEQVQLTVQSTLARLLIFEGSRKSVDIEKLTYFQETHSIYKAFIENFIRGITLQGVDAYCKGLAQQFMQKRNMLRNKMSDNEVFIDNRTNDMCMWLNVSFGKFLEFALQVGAINQEQFEQYIEESMQIFLSLMERQAERVSDLDDIRRFFKGLQVLTETKEAKIEKLQARNNNYTATDSRMAIGFSKKGFVYLKNGVAFQCVVAYYRKFGKEFAVNESELRKSLCDSGYILQKSENSYVHRLFVNHETYQCIKFEENKFKQLLNGGKQNGTEGDREIPGNWGMYQNADNYLGR